MWTVNIQMFKLVLEKAEEPEIKSPSPGTQYFKGFLPTEPLYSGLFAQAMLQASKISHFSDPSSPQLPPRIAIT